MLPAALLVSCLASDPVKITTHCGLKHVRLEYAGRLWQFTGVGEDNNSPDGWGDPWETVYVVEVEGDQMTAIGPDGRRLSLVVTEEIQDRPCF